MAAPITFIDFPDSKAIVGDGSVESPTRIMFIAAFEISRDPILNEHYRPFVQKGGYENPTYWTADGWAFRTERGFAEPSYFDDPIWGAADVPVTGVSWYEADAFCRWLGGRLPSEWEWERTCGGPNGCTYPWGSYEPDDTMANFAPTGDLAVRLPTRPDRFEVNVTSDGVRDLSGNFAEWCAETFETADGSPTKVIQYVTRGGCALDTAEFLRCDARSASPPKVRDNLISFRAARNPVKA